MTATKVDRTSRTPDTDVPFAQVPYWLMRSRHLTHLQFRALVVLLGLLGGRTRPTHFTYVWLAEQVNTDKNSLGKAMALFRERGWIEVTGRQQHQKYVLSLDKMRADMWSEKWEVED